LEDKQRLFAYQFDGYWKDVGTISSLWEANMDLLNPESGLVINDRNWKIFARNTAQPPQYIGDEATIGNSIISEGCRIDGKITNSVIYYGAKISKGAEIKDSIIMPYAEVGENARVCHAIVGWNTKIGNNCVVGAPQDAPVAGEWRIAVVAPDMELERNSVVKEGEMKGGNK
ncbi:MAG: glucose-1-phosphate adenylyltransferase, partial [Clostridia bacterium]|nr:glucose-1-phosphate adenylyltransferase [Clostridia bacterium]